MNSIKPHIKKVFLGIIFAACFSCYAKPDYNLPLFAFAYLLWDAQKPSHKVRLSYLFLFSLIVDFVWLVYWGPFWNSQVFTNHWATGVQTFVLVLAVLIFLVKIAVLAMCILGEEEVKNAFTPNGFVSSAKSLFSPGGNPEQRNY